MKSQSWSTFHSLKLLLQGNTTMAFMLVFPLMNAYVSSSFGDYSNIGRERLLCWVYKPLCLSSKRYIFKWEFSPLRTLQKWLPVLCDLWLLQHSHPCLVWRFLSLGKAQKCTTFRVENYKTCYYLYYDQLVIFVSKASMMAPYLSTHRWY